MKVKDLIGKLQEMPQEEWVIAQGLHNYSILDVVKLPGPEMIKTEFGGHYFGPVVIEVAADPD